MLAAGTLTFPLGRLIVAIYSADAQMTLLRLESLSNDGWEPVTTVDLTADWTPSPDKTNVFPYGIITDGVTWRLRNTSGANAISGIEYYYMPV